MPDHDISATILLADYAIIDAVGKLNIVGGGVSLLGYNYEQGATAPFTLFVRLARAMPSTDRPAVEFVLADASGNPVQIPGPVGEPQVMRIGQNVEFPPANVPGANVPVGSIPSYAAFAFNFANGLPLAPGHSYSWRVQVDHDVIASESFFIPTPSPGPVIG